MQQDASIGIVTHQGWACVRQGGFLRGFYVVALHIFTLHLWEMVQSTRICIYVTMSLCRQIPTQCLWNDCRKPPSFGGDLNWERLWKNWHENTARFEGNCFLPKENSDVTVVFWLWRLRLGLEEVKTQGAPRDFLGGVCGESTSPIHKEPPMEFPNVLWLNCLRAFSLMFSGGSPKSDKFTCGFSDWYLVYLEITNSEIRWIFCWWLLGSAKKSSWDRYCSLSPKQESLAGACPRISL